MLKRNFIPLLVGLLFVVVLIYYIGGGSTPRARNVKEAVPVEHFTLRNGLTVVVMPNHKIPVVTHMMLVKAGAADDPYGKTGLAHYLEHLMFTGTKNFAEGEYDRSVARVGGEQNAYTTNDYTVFFSTVPKDQLEMVMTLEADRLANLEFLPEKAKRELGVVTEERTMRVDNRPDSQWGEQLNAITFLNHPYGRPTIGWAEDIAGLTPADARGFFDRYYRPGNMVLVVAGDVNPRDVRRMAQRHYGGLAGGAQEVRSWPHEPPIRLEREATMRDPRVHEPRVLIQFVAPSVREGATAQALPLSLFAQYLGGGSTSALYTTLVRERKLAVSIAADYNPYVQGPGVFRLIAIPAPGVEPKALQAAMMQELAHVLAAAPDHAGLERARTVTAAEIIFAQDGMESLARVMVSLYGIGLDEQYFYSWMEAVQGVTDAAALEAAKATLVPSHAVTGYLLVQEKPTEPATPSEAKPAEKAKPAPAAPTMEVPYGI